MPCRPSTHTARSSMMRLRAPPPSAQNARDGFALAVCPRCTLTTPAATTRAPNVLPKAKQQLLPTQRLRASRPRRRLLIISDPSSLVGRDGSRTNYSATQTHPGMLYRLRVPSARGAPCRSSWWVVRRQRPSLGCGQRAFPQSASWYSPYVHQRPRYPVHTDQNLFLLVAASLVGCFCKLHAEHASSTSTKSSIMWGCMRPARVVRGEVSRG